VQSLLSLPLDHRRQANQRPQQAHWHLLQPPQQQALHYWAAQAQDQAQQLVVLLAQAGPLALVQQLLVLSPHLLLDPLPVHCAAASTHQWLQVLALAAFLQPLLVVLVLTPRQIAVCHSV
jgi:hypothetical protein